MWLLRRLCCEIRRGGGTVHNVSLAHGHQIAIILGVFARLRKAIITSVVSVRLSSLNDLATNGRIFVKFEYYNRMSSLNDLPTNGRIFMKFEYYLRLSSLNELAINGRIFMKYEYSSKICREKFKLH